MALTDNLLSFWKLEESSGTRNDEVGSNDLADNNTVTSTTGKVGDAAYFTRANSEVLSIASASQSPDLSINGASGDIFLSCWVNLASKPAGQMAAIAKYNFTNGQREYWLFWDNTTDRFQFQVFNSTSTSNTVTASTFGAPSTSTWYHLMAWVDNTANTVNISVNNGTVDSTALTVTTHNGTAPFLMGATGASGGFFTFWDGAIDAAGVWSAVKDSTERSTLYNSGNGLEYPFTVASTFLPRIMVY